MIKIEIDNKIYRVKELHELNIDTFFELNEFVKKNHDNILYFNKELLKRLTHIPNHIIRIIPHDQLIKIDLTELILNGVKTTQLKKKYLGKEILDYNKITLGQYIDLDYWLTNENVDEPTRMANVVATVLLLKNKGDTTITEFGNIIKERLNVGDIVTIHNHFTEWRLNMVKNHTKVFGEPIDDDEEIELPVDAPEPDFSEDNSELERWGWLGIAYGLTDPVPSQIDITKTEEVLNMNFLEVLTFLSYQKDLNDELTKQAKDAERKNKYR